MHVRIAKPLEEIRTQRWARLFEVADRITGAVERLDHRFKPGHLMTLVIHMRESAAQENSPKHLRDVAAAINAIAIDLEKLSNQLVDLLPHVPSHTASSLLSTSKSVGTDCGSLQKTKSNWGAIRTHNPQGGRDA